MEFGAEWVGKLKGAKVLVRFSGWQLRFGLGLSWVGLFFCLDVLMGWFWFGVP